MFFLKQSLTVLLVLICASQFGAADDASAIKVPLTVNAGVPLRVYVTSRVHMREGESVQARLIDPIYSFDRVVVPSGVQLQGHVTTLDPVSKWKRTQAILNGDFTPLHFARVEFTSILMPDGKTLSIHTLDSEGMLSIYSPPRPSKKKAAQNTNHQPQTPGVIGNAKDQIKQQINAKTQGVIEAVRGPNKKEWLEDYLIHKLPYHPQWYRRNTRFDAVLTAPLDFGTISVAKEALSGVGLPAGDSSAQVRLLTALSSGESDTNTQVTGVLSQPIFSSDHKLILPEGTLLTGRVRKAQPARWFHRGGQLRFTFDRVEPPSLVAVQPISVERTPVLLSAAESDPHAKVKVDSEGDAKATEPKSRLLAPALAMLVATKAADNDAGKHGVGTGGADANYGGRTAGGFSGFGVFGSAAAQGSKMVGTVLGYYGLAWTVFQTIISRGNEVEFNKNAAIDVRFGANASPQEKAQSPLLAGTPSASR